MTRWLLLPPVNMSLKIEDEMILEHDSLEEIKKKLEKIYMVVILHALNSDLDHIRNQILIGCEIPTWKVLRYNFLSVPALKGQNFENSLNFHPCYLHTWKRGSWN